VLKGLTARLQFGKLNRNANAKEYFPPYMVGNFIRGGQNGLLFTNNQNASTPMSRVSNSDQLGESTTLSGSYQLIGTLGYAKQFRNSDFDIMVGFDQGESEAQNVFFYKNGQLVNGIDEFWAFNNTGQTIRNPQYTQSVKRSFLGRMNYTVMDRYMLEVIARYDASSNFPPETRWGLFPSVGLGWKISEEKFFREAFPFINSMKIRSNFGLVGEDRVANRLWQSRFTSTTGMLFGTVVTNGLDPNVYPNPDITWEKSRTWNAGFDMTMLRGRLSFSYDYYNRYTFDGFDKLENGVLPPTTGINTAVVNYGKQISWGHEFTLGYRGSIAKDWGFNADVNWGFSNSQLLQSYYNGALLGQYGPNQLGIMLGRDPRQYNSSNFGYIAKGILRTQEDVDRVLGKNPNYLIGGQKPQVGFMDFEDINGDGKIDDNDITTMFDRTTPLIGFGMTFGVNYKSFKLQMNMNLRLGGKSFYDTEARKVPTNTQNAPSFWADSWTPENPNAKFPRANAPLAKENSSFWAVNGTQSRINNMVLSYSIPKKVAERYRIPEFRAFLTGTNLWNLINPLKYKDPYTSNFASYPTLRTISVGLNVTL
jgi:TonB-linked SusC/RagA family outer membrane protein